MMNVFQETQPFRVFPFYSDCMNAPIPAKLVA